MNYIDQLKFYEICTGGIEEKPCTFGFLRVFKVICYQKRFEEFLKKSGNLKLFMEKPMLQEYIEEVKIFQKRKSIYPASLLFYLLSNELYTIEEIIEHLKEEYFTSVQKKYLKSLGKKKSNKLYKRKFYYKETTKSFTKEELILYIKNKTVNSKSIVEAECCYHLCSSSAVMMTDFTKRENNINQKTYTTLESNALDKIFSFLDLSYDKKLSLKVIEKATKQELLYTKNELLWTIYKSKYPFELTILKDSVKEYFDHKIRLEKKLNAELLLVALPSKLTPVGKNFLKEIMQEMNKLLKNSNLLEKIFDIASNSEPLVSDYEIKARELVYKVRFEGNEKKAHENQIKLLNEFSSFDYDNFDNWFKQAEEDAEKKEYIENSDLLDSYNKLLRKAENAVREEHELPRVGEGWISETELFYMVKEYLYEKFEVLHGESPKFLGRQHLDIYIPKLLLAIEYQGAQHYEPVEFFGGEEAFEKSQERDQRKKKLCEKNNVKLLYVKKGYNFKELTSKIEERIKELFKA